MCGGVKTDINGATTITGLYAIGECAFTGLHGANRLASNSLLEGMVFSTARRGRASRTPRASARRRSRRGRSGAATDSNDAIVVSLNWDEIRRFMWSYLGIVRSDKRIERARRRIEILRDEIREYYIDFKITSDLHRAPQPRARRAPRHRERAPPQGIARPALHARLSRTSCPRRATPSSS